MLKYGFVLESYMHKAETGINSLDVPFCDSVNYGDKLSFTAQLNLYVSDEDGRSTGEKIAELYLYLFNNDKILEACDNLVSVADMHTEDIYNAMVALICSKEFEKEIDVTAKYKSLFTCYIDRLYVYPKFRRQGIGRYVLDNLADMLDYAFNSPIHCFVIYPRPQDGDDSVTGQKMRQIMKHTLKKAGYTALGRSGFYAKNCVAVDFESKRDI